MSRKINKKFPSYVKFKNNGKTSRSCLKHRRRDGVQEFYRHAGDWAVKFEIKQDKIFVNEPPPSQACHLHGMELIECSREEWEEDNGGYI